MALSHASPSNAARACTTVSEATPLMGGKAVGSPNLAVEDGNHKTYNRDSWRGFSKRISDMIVYHTGSIGMLGSISIATNSLTGPAMLNLPAQYQRSGIIPTTATIVFVCILSALCSLHMANTISKVPGNHNFKREVEFSEAFRAFWGQGWFLASQLLFFCCISCLNISSIVFIAQVIDTFLGHWWPGGGSAALLVTAHRVDWLRWDYTLCSHQDLLKGICMPFRGETGVLFTAGNLLVTVIFLPLALMDLKDNAAWQVAAFLVLLATSLQFIIQFVQSGMHLSYTSWWGHDWDDLFGVVLFNFALVIAVPAWLYEREPHVSVPTVITSSSVLSAVLYISIGLLGNMAMPNVSDNMLESMMSGAFGTWMQLGASVFAFAIIGLGIPLFSVLTRLNLTGSGLCSQRSGSILAVYFPFGVSWLLYGGSKVSKLLGWGGVIFTSLVAFILPITLALHVAKEFDYEGSIAVYFSWIPSKRQEIFSLKVLLALTVGAIVFALVGTTIID